MNEKELEGLKELSEKNERKENGFYKDLTRDSRAACSDKEFALLLQKVVKDMERTKEWRDRIAQTIEPVNEIREKLQMNDIGLGLLHLHLYEVAYRKVGYDVLRKKPVIRTLDPCDIVLDENAKCVNTAERITYISHLTKEEILDMQQTGVYNNTDLPYLKHAKKEDKFTIYEVHAYGRFYAKDDGVLPYLIAIDALTGKVLGMRRNWNWRDAERERFNYCTQHSTSEAEQYLLRNCVD